MAKIALETEVRSVGGKGSATTNKCCTKARADALGCKIKSGYSYKDNQLIEQGSYEKDLITYIGFYATATASDEIFLTIPKGQDVYPYNNISSGVTPPARITWVCIGRTVKHNVTSSTFTYYYGRNVLNLGVYQGEYYNSSTNARIAVNNSNGTNVVIITSTSSIDVLFYSGSTLKQSRYNINVFTSDNIGEFI